jgi:hypothetical protein
VRLEELGNLKKSVHLIGSRTRYLPACSIATTLLRDPRNLGEERCGIIKKKKERKWLHVLFSSFMCRSVTSVSERTPIYLFTNIALAAIASMSMLVAAMF